PPRGRIAMVVRDWPHDEQGAAFAAPLMEGAGRLKAVGLESVFFAFSERTDRQWIERLRRTKHPLVVWNPEQETPAEFVEQLRGCDLAVSARYHGAVFAALLGKPVACIEVEPKLRLAAEALDCVDTLWKRPFAAAQFERIVMETMNRHAEASAAVFRAAQRQRALTEGMIERFIQFAPSA
ncbi:MAG: polysaccharide pyruvyl transferase family protein, partial [Candidatus Sumerlaeota bacterium]|nr:polysaccharide pyruvyl transferase family protein [Candidatus Sumerlaeota bacterium]